MHQSRRVVPGFCFVILDLELCMAEYTTKQIEIRLKLLKKNEG